MAKVPSDRLFLLIKSLTGAERRHFKIFVRGRTEKQSHYVELFDLIARRKRFNDAKFQKIIYPKGSDSQKYSELKNYLYHLILQSLGTFDHKSSVDFRLNQFLQNILVLYKRGAYDDCLDQLKKARRLAQQYERLPFLLDIFKWEKQIAYARIDVDFLVHQLGKIGYEEQKVLEEIANVSFFRQKFYEVLAIVKREAVLRGEDRLAMLQSIMEDGRLWDADVALTHTARVYFFRIKNLYHYAVAEHEEFYDSGRSLIALLESQPHFLKDNLSDYIAALSNFILSCGFLKRYDEVRETLEKVQQIDPITLDDRLKVHRQYFTNKLVLCIFTGDFEEGKAEMSRHIDGIKKLPVEEQETASFYFQYFCICFGSGDFEQALDWLNQWLSQPKTTDREDLQSLARILELMLHFEMENHQLCESLLRSATRFITRRERYFALERGFMECMGNVLKTADAAYYEKQPFAVFLEDLQEIRQQPESKVLLQTFDLEAWLVAKSNGRSFAEVVRERSGAV